MIGDFAVLPYQLVQPLSGHNALTIRIDVSAVAVARRCAVDGRPESHRLAIRPRAENQVQVARVEPIDDAAALLVQSSIVLSDRRGGF